MWDEALLFERNFSDLLKSFIKPKVILIFLTIIKLEIARQRRLAMDGGANL